MSNRFRGGHEGIGRCDHLVPRPDPYSLERQDQSISAICHPDHLARAQELTKGLLESLDRRPEDEGRIAKNWSEPLLHLLADRLVLPGQVEKRHVHRDPIQSLNLTAYRLVRRAAPRPSHI